VEGRDPGWIPGAAGADLRFSGAPPVGPTGLRGQAPPLWSKSSSGIGSGSVGSNSGDWSRSSGKESWATSSCFPLTGPMASSVWGGPLAGWRSGGEVGSPMWARSWLMGWGSVRNAMNVSGVWQVGQISGKTS